MKCSRVTLILQVLLLLLLHVHRYCSSNSTTNPKNHHGTHNHHHQTKNMVIPFLPYYLRCALSDITFLHCNVYAAYHSYKAISKKDNLSMIRWMSYWSMIGVMVFLEYMFGLLLHGIIPFYPEIKFALLLSLIISPNAAYNLFQGAIIPFLKANGLDLYLKSFLSTVSHYAVIGMTFLNITLIDKCIEFGLVDASALEIVRERMDMFAKGLAGRIPALRSASIS